MRKLILIVHVSMDGYVANEDGGFEGFDQSPENLDIVCNLTEQADTLLAGRVSYQMLNQYWVTAGENVNASQSEIKYANWYNRAKKIVLSKSLAGNSGENTIIISDRIAERLHEYKNTAGKDILMFGSPTAFQTLNDLDLIDEYWIIYYPCFLGGGIPFFTGVSSYKKFKLINTKQLSNGELAIHYKAER